MFTYNLTNRTQQLGLVSYTLHLIHEQNPDRNLDTSIVVREDQDTFDYLNNIALNIINQQLFEYNIKYPAHVPSFEDSTESSLPSIDTSSNNTEFSATELNFNENNTEYLLSLSSISTGVLI